MIKGRMWNYMEHLFYLPFLTLKKISRRLWFYCLQSQRLFTEQYLVSTYSILGTVVGIQILKSHFSHAYDLLACNRNNNNKRIRSVVKKNKAGWGNRVTGELVKLGSGLWSDTQFKHFKWTLAIGEKHLSTIRSKEYQEHLCSNLQRPKYSQ